MKKEANLKIKKKIKAIKPSMKPYIPISKNDTARNYIWIGKVFITKNSEFERFVERHKAYAAK